MAMIIGIRVKEGRQEIKNMIVKAGCQAQP